MSVTAIPQKPIGMMSLIIAYAGNSYHIRLGSINDEYRRVPPQTMKKMAQNIRYLLYVDMGYSLLKI
jgi:hypothetical protein